MAPPKGGVFAFKRRYLIALIALGARSAFPPRDVNCILAAAKPDSNIS
jgi:hypothetical protein